MDEVAGVATAVPPEPIGIMAKRAELIGKETVNQHGVYVLLPRKTRRVVDKLLRKGMPLTIALLHVGVQPFIRKEKPKDDKSSTGVPGETASA